MCSDSFQLLGMAERGFLPAALARRSRYGTPTLAIILSSIGILMLVTFDFLQVHYRSIFFDKRWQDMSDLEAYAMQVHVSRRS